MILSFVEQSGHLIVFINLGGGKNKCDIMVGMDTWIANKKSRQSIEWERGRVDKIVLFV